MIIKVTYIKYSYSNEFVKTLAFYNLKLSLKTAYQLFKHLFPVQYYFLTPCMVLNVTNNSMRR